MTDPGVIPPSKPQRVDLTSLIAANVAPIVGMIFLHWSPPMLVALYAIDTILSLTSMMWLVMEHITEAKSPDRGVKRAFKLGMGAFLGAAIFAAMLVGPVVFMFADGAWMRSRPWLDPGFQGAVAVQVVGSLYALVRTHRMLNERDDDEPWLAGQFRFLVARWVVVLGVVFVGLAPALGETIGGALIVIAYAGATVWFTMFPDRAYRMFFPNKPAPPMG